MRLLITGANGFIGKAVVASLSRKHEIFALVRNRDNCPLNKNVKFIAHDFANRLDINILPANIDGVIHLAQSNEYRNFPEGLRDMCDVNISGLVDVLEYARNAGCRQFINFSSGSVYSAEPYMQTEESIIKPSAAYPLSKYVSEQITDLYSNFLNTLNIRLFFPYGPGQEGMLIPNIIASVKNGSKIGLQGTQGGLVLCPIYIDDVITIIEQCLLQETTGLINVGGIEVLTLHDIASEIARNIGREPVFNIDNAATPGQFKPSLDRMKKIIGNTEITSFEDGIYKTLKFRQ